MTVDVRLDDLTSPEVLALVSEHLADMHGNSPPGHAHALAATEFNVFMSRSLDRQGGERAATL